jgi:hypothetical protein
MFIRMESLNVEGQDPNFCICKYYIINKITSLRQTNYEERVMGD